jgi:hypothetical protein
MVMGKVIRLRVGRVQSSERLRRFRQAYFDYLEGEREDPPLLELLNETDRRRAEGWIKSLDACRGIDPYSKPPSVADIMARLFQKR